MAIYCESSFFNVRPGTGTQTVILAASDAVPLAILFYKNGEGGSGFGAWAWHSMGMDDGITHYGVGHAFGEGPTGGDESCTQTSVAYSIVSPYNFIEFNSSGLLGYVSTMGTGQFIVTFTVNQSSHTGEYVNYVAICNRVGEGEILKYLTPITTASSPGTVTITSSFAPRALIMIAHPLVYSTSPNTVIAANTSMAPGWGWASRCGPDAICFAGALRPQSSSFTHCYQKRGSVISILFADGVIAAEAEVQSWNTDGVTLNFLSATGGVWYSALLIGGNIGANVGVFTQGDTTVPFLAQDPRVMLFGSVAKPTATTVQTDMNLMIGSLQSQQGVPDLAFPKAQSQWTEDKTGTGPPSWTTEERTESNIDAPVLIRRTTGAGSATTIAVGSKVSFDPQLLTLTWDVDDGTPREIGYLVLGHDSSHTQPCGDAELALGCPESTGTVGIVYSSAFVVTGGAAPFTFSITAGALPTGLALDTSTGDVTGTPTASGLFTFTGHVVDALDAEDSADCSITILPLTLSCPAGAGQNGVAYSSAFTVTGGTAPFTFSITTGSLPTGLSLNTSTGAVTGTPTVNGTFAFTGHVVDANSDTDDADCSITITTAPVTLTLACPSGYAQVGDAYSSAFVASGGTTPYGPYAIIAGALPTGLTLNTATGAVTGVPVTAGTYNFTGQVTDDADATATAECSIIVAAGPTFTIRRIRRFALPFDRNLTVFIQRFEVVIQSGLSDNAVLYARFSRDGGNTFGAYIPMESGERNAFTTRLFLNRLGRGRDWIAEVMTESPDPWFLIECNIDYEEGTA